MLQGNSPAAVLQGNSPAAVLQVKLVVLDSITFHFRQDVQDMGQRSRMLYSMAQSLMQIAEAHDLAVRMLAWSRLASLRVQ